MIYRKSYFGHRKSFGLIGSVPGVTGGCRRTPGRGVTTKGVHGMLEEVDQPLLGCTRLSLKSHAHRDKGIRQKGLKGKEEESLQGSPLPLWEEDSPLVRPNLSSLEEGPRQPSLSLLLYILEVLAFWEHTINLSQGVALSPSSSSSIVLGEALSECHVAPSSPHRRAAGALPRPLLPPHCWRRHRAERVLNTEAPLFGA